MTPSELEAQYRAYVDAFCESAVPLEMRLSFAAWSNLSAHRRNVIDAFIDALPKLTAA